MGMFGKSEPKSDIKQGDVVDHGGVMCVVVKATDAGLYLVPVGPPVPASECAKVG